MHYSNLVIIGGGTRADDVASAIEEAMGPDEDNGGFWDWYQIGGRWTGILSGYDPETDPQNVETCNLCGGTGDRKDLQPPDWKEKCGGCNGCNGKGKRVKWSTEWAEHRGDIMPIELLTETGYSKFYRVVIRGRAFGGEEYLPWKPLEEMFKRREKPPLVWLKKEYEGHLVVVVDNHS